MTKYILALAFFGLLASYANAQEEYKISFSYDAAGNQILRDRVCVNCSSAKTQIDSTAISTLDEKLDELKDIEGDTSNSSIIAYPNPVTDILLVEWVATNNTVQTVTLFSGTGKLLQTKKIKPKAVGLDLEFRGYPPGSYYVVVRYADKTKQSFQVIKN